MLPLKASFFVKHMLQDARFPLLMNVHVEHVHVLLDGAVEWHTLDGMPIDIQLCDHIHGVSEDSPIMKATVSLTIPDLNDEHSGHIDICDCESDQTDQIMNISDVLRQTLDYESVFN